MIKSKKVGRPKKTKLKDGTKATVQSYSATYTYQPPTKEEIEAKLQQEKNDLIRMLEEIRIFLTGYSITFKIDCISPINNRHIRALENAQTRIKHS